MDLLTIPLPLLRRALEIAEEREALDKQLNNLLRGRAKLQSLWAELRPPVRPRKRSNEGARRYWREWRKKKEAANAA